MVECLHNTHPTSALVGRVSQTVQYCSVQELQLSVIIGNFFLSVLYIPLPGGMRAIEQEKDPAQFQFNFLASFLKNVCCLQK